ncbi:timeless protein-domain-containing protein [Hysterangium stoloniferum]|nr:timeless protein-domain-containing protein [Hysterangium stoloniferum]
MAIGDELSEISSREGSPEVDRIAILTPAITSVISALGGQQGGQYVLGDEAYGCLKDLKKFWRKDDTDDERTVARIFWKTRVLQSDLVPILLETAGRGNVEDRCAVICAELITSMTWPIDMASELMELDEELDVGTDYTALLNSHLSYKATLLQPGALQALFGIMLPCLAKTRKERKERDGQIINVVLHLFRNLAFIRDLPSNSHLSADQAEYSSMQSKYIAILDKTHILDALVTLAVNADNDPLFTSWNTVLLEIFYLLFRGVKPSSLIQDQIQTPKDDLTRLLAIENQRKRNVQRNAASRHSRFGTTITVKAGQEVMVLHSQEAITKEAREIVDGNKKSKHQKAKTLDDLRSQDNLAPQALLILQRVAREFIEFCFNSFLASLLKDIKSERPKITEKDHLRLLFVTKWFLEFFLLTLAKSKEKQSGWSPTFPMVGEVIDRSWIVWILRRMRGALDEKPKQWVELQAGIECLTQLLLLIDDMSTVTDATLSEAAEVLQHQLYYNGEILDLSYDGLQGYKDQSIAYLDSAIHLAYVLLRMLEKWGNKKGDVYVRRRRARAKNRRKAKGSIEGEGVLDVEDVEEEASDKNDMIEEQMFTFDKFEAKFASEDIARTLLICLARFRELSPEHMKRVVSLIHRQAVRAKAEGLFFKVSTLDLFKTVLAEEKTLLRSQPFKDLVQLINYILRQFFKAVEKEPFLVVEAFFPKNRGQWKNYSSWEPEQKAKKLGNGAVTSFHPSDVRVKKGYSWSEELAIAIACLLENDQRVLIDWIREILMIVIGIRQRIVEETAKTGEGSDSGDEIDDDEKLRRQAAKLKGPSKEAIVKFEDYLIPYVNDEQALAATKNAPFKLVCRLIKFCVLDDSQDSFSSHADELDWYVPAAILPSDMQSSLGIIDKYLESPSDVLDLNGEKASKLLVKKRARRARRRAATSEPESDAEDNEDTERRKRKAKKVKEHVQYKSAEIIEDSDAELGDDEEFFKREAAIRDRAALAAAEGRSGTMKATGTKKRKKRGEGEGPEKKKWKTTVADAPSTHINGSQLGGASSNSDSDEPAEDVPETSHSERRSSSAPFTVPDEFGQKPRPKPRPKRPPPGSSSGSKDPSNLIGEDDSVDSVPPRPKPRARPSFESSPSISGSHSGSDEEIEMSTQMVRRKAPKAVILSDDDDGDEK